MKYDMHECYAMQILEEKKKRKNIRCSLGLNAKIGVYIIGILLHNQIKLVCILS